MQKKELTAFDEATLRIEKQRKIEKFIYWGITILVPGIIFLGFSYVQKHVDSQNLKAFYSQEIVENLKKLI